MTSYSTLSTCRICKNPCLEKVIDLGEQVIASQFPIMHTPDPPSAPLVLVKCMGGDEEDTCGLLQLLHTVDASELYEKTYGYRSGLNATMTQHLKTIVEQAIQYVSLQEGDTVLDIGSNDATLLQWYRTLLPEKTLQKIGIDPTGRQFREFYTADTVLVEDYFTEDSWKKASPSALAKVITSIAMFYDLPDPIRFMEDVKKALHPEGIWIMEQSYLPTMLETRSFDTICHEHLEYYGVEQILWMCKKVGLRIVDIATNTCNGGSFRVVLSHPTAPFPPCNLQPFLAKEQQLQLHRTLPYHTFMQQCHIQKRRLLRFVQDITHQGKEVCLYGASTKGNTLLQYYDIQYPLITCAAERNPLKYGRWTPKTHIPIVCEQEVREKNPPFLLVLPWHFKEEFLTREQAYLEQGGQFLFPLPDVHLVSRAKKALLTGITGQIGSYMKDLLLSKGYIVYGMCREIPQNHTEENVFYLTGNIQDKSDMEDIIYTVRPDEIYHFAGITNSYLSKTHLLDTLNINNKPVENILDILHTYHTVYGTKIPFFHSSSVEIWKGSMDGYFHEGSLPLIPLTPYGISKAYTYMLCNYYRDTYHLPIYQGIFSSIESPRRREGFVLAKVAKYIASYTDHSEPLTLGEVQVYRDWLHAKDAVEGVYTLVQTGTPRNALITRGDQVSLQYAIQQMFSYRNLIGEWNTQNQFIEEESGKILVQGNTNDRVQEEPLCVKTYDSSFLRTLGWTPHYSLSTILQEYITTYLDQSVHS